MRRVVAADKGETDDDVPNTPPRLWHDADYVIRTWMEHRTHHTYPEPGGYNDQDEWLMLDWHVMNVYYSRVHAGVFGGVALNVINATNWQSIMKD